MSSNTTQTRTIREAKKKRQGRKRKNKWPTTALHCRQSCLKWLTRNKASRRCPYRMSHPWGGFFYFAKAATKTVAAEHVGRMCSRFDAGLPPGGSRQVSVR